MLYQGACNCGAVKMGISTEPIMTYNCHCSHCRAFASRFENEQISYHECVFVWQWSAKVEGNVDYEPSVALGGLFGLNRGRCAACKQPVWEKGQRFAAPYAMVMASPLNIKPDTNIYYNSGLQNGPNDMKITIRSDWGSLLYEIWIVLTVAIPMLPASIIALFRSNEFKKNE